MRIRWLALIALTLLLVACSSEPTATEEGAGEPGATTALSRGEVLSDLHVEIRLKPTRDPIPPYIHVPDSALDRFCMRIDSLYRLRAYDRIASAKSEVLGHLASVPVGVDPASKRNAQQAIARIAEALRRTQRVDKSADLMGACINAWSVRWPQEDSVLAEQVLIRARDRVTLEDTVGALADFDAAIARMERAGHMNRAGSLARLAGLGAFNLDLRDISRHQFHRAIAFHRSDPVPDTNLIVGTTLNLVLPDPDSADHHVRAVAHLIDHVTMPRARSMYFSMVAQLKARRQDVSGAIIAHLQEISAYDHVDTMTIEEQVSQAMGLHNFAFTLYNVDRVDEALYYMQGAIQINEMLAEDSDPDVAKWAKERLVTNTEFILTEVMPPGAVRASLATDRLWLKHPLDLSIDPRPYARTLKNRAGDYYHKGDAGLDSLVAITRRLEATGEFGTAVQYFMGVWFVRTNQPDSAIQRVERGMRRKTRDGRFELAHCREASVKPTTWNAKETGIFGEVLEMLAERYDEPLYRQYLTELSELEQRLIDSLFVQEDAAIPSLIRSRKEMNNRMIRMIHAEHRRRPSAEHIKELVARIDDSKAMLLKKDRYHARKSGGVALMGMIAGARMDLEEIRQDTSRASTDRRPMLLQRIDSLEKVLAGIPAHESLPSRADTGLLSALRASLDAGTVVLDYLMTKNDIFISEIRSDTVVVARVVRDPLFEGALERTLASVGTKHRGTRPADGDLVKLGAALLPAFMLGENVMEVVVIPDGELCYLPFEALRVPKQNGPSTLLDLLEVRYAFSASILAQGVEPNSAPVDPKVLGVAPLYRIDLPAIAQPGGAQRSNGLAELKNNDAEVEGISSITPTEVLIGVDADEASFKRALPTSDVIHLAMHAFADPDEPLRSGLVFAQGAKNTGWQFSLLGLADDDADGEDGVLHAYEIPSGSMQANLVVLSACETGAGLWRSGDGVRSLARVFYEAGVDAVVSSLWKVDDRATKEIMVKFYENLAEGMGKADALAEAKRWYRKEYPNEPPSKWAAFILIGDNEPVHLIKRTQRWPWMAGGAVALGAVLLLIIQLRRAQ